MNEEKFSLFYQDTESTIYAFISRHFDFQTTQDICADTFESL